MKPLASSVACVYFKSKTLSDRRKLSYDTYLERVRYPVQVGGHLVVVCILLAQLIEELPGSDEVPLNVMVHGEWIQRAVLEGLAPRDFGRWSLVGAAAS